MRLLTLTCVLAALCTPAAAFTLDDCRLGNVPEKMLRAGGYCDVLSGGSISTPSGGFGGGSGAFPPPTLNLYGSGLMGTYTGQTREIGGVTHYIYRDTNGLGVPHAVPASAI